MERNIVGLNFLSLGFRKDLCMISAEFEIMCSEADDTFCKLWNAKHMLSENN